MHYLCGNVLAVSLAPYCTVRKLCHGRDAGLYWRSRTVPGVLPYSTRPHALPFSKYCPELRRIEVAVDMIPDPWTDQQLVINSTISMQSLHFYTKMWPCIALQGDVQETENIVAKLRNVIPKNGSSTAVSRSSYRTQLDFGTNYVLRPWMISDLKSSFHRVCPS